MKVTLLDEIVMFVQLNDKPVVVYKSLPLIRHLLVEWFLSDLPGFNTDLSAPVNQRVRHTPNSSIWWSWQALPQIANGSQTHLANGADKVAFLADVSPDSQVVRHAADSSSQRLHRGSRTSLSQQTQNICITFVQCWTNVEDVGTTLYKCCANVLCLLGYTQR